MSLVDIAGLVRLFNQRRTEFGVAIAAFAGVAVLGVLRGSDDHLVAGYLWPEALGNLSKRDVGFLTRTAVLTRMSGALCDVVLGARRSSETLERLEASNLFVVPLDRRREWYRYHHLFRDLLRSEIQRRDRAAVVGYSPTRSTGARRTVKSPTRSRTRTRARTRIERPRSSRDTPSRFISAVGWRRWRPGCDGWTSADA
jgi:hypothetical protein